MSERPRDGLPPGGVTAPAGAAAGSREPWPATAPDEPVLDAAARSRVEELVRRYPSPRAALIPALHIAQRRCGGWLPDYAIEAVARELALPPSEVYGVVTFYDLFHQRPVGRHRIRVCNNLPCQLRGADEILEVLHAELGIDEGEVTPDGRCSFVHFECLGSCDTAPMAMIDDTYHENLTPARVREILKGLL
jgi:NADH-quinone oxidoreductase E subunit